ncbi:MAG: aryl-sulfate sulfotransferase, partial [Chitinispirillaceae bacterium]|nr:aryl-sulfate sulfotransferase [Chitinispirillaceae bacterium]
MKKILLLCVTLFVWVTIAVAGKPEGIQYISPVPNSTLNSRTSVVIIRPGEKLNRSSIDFSKQIIVTDKEKNPYSGDIILSSDDKTLIFKPKAQYKAGEVVNVTFLSGVKDISGRNIPSFEFQFTVTPLEKRLDPKDYLPQTNSGISELRKALAKSLVETADEPLPSNFPKFTVTQGTGTPAEGYIFLSPSHFVDKKGFNLIIDNSGNVVYWKEITDGAPVDFKVLPNGYLSYGSMYEFYDFTGGGPTIFRMIDKSYTVVDSFMMGNGYIAESHEFQLLPNGHALMLSYDLQPVDMSKIVEGGHPGALVVGSIIQELDVDKNVVFQWRSWDYLDIRESYNDLKLTVFDPIHINSIEMDSDKNLIVSIMGFAQVAKINRQTGEIMWRMGGVKNQFTFINEEEVSAYAPVYFMYQHEVRRLPNGNILMIDDGEKGRRPWSRVVEYKVDETNFTATKVWQYRPNPDICITTMGSAQRLPNGNTLIGWGMASATGKIAVTEVDKNGNVVLTLAFKGNLWASYRAYKFNWNGGEPCAVVFRQELKPNNNYEFNDSIVGVDNRIDSAGCKIKLDTISGSGYNEVYVARYNYAPFKPKFSGKTPLVLPTRTVFQILNWGYFKATIKFDAILYKITKPESVTVYQRALELSEKNELIGKNEFTAIPT